MLGNVGALFPGPEAVQMALNSLENARKKLASDKDRPAAEAELRTALNDYFIADMQHRVTELDKIRARVAEMEASLQKRLDARETVVDLQFRLYLQEADGLGFFPKGDRATTATLLGRRGGDAAPIQRPRVMHTREFPFSELLKTEQADE